MVALKAHDFEGLVSGRGRSFPVVLVYGPDSGLVAERAARLARQSIGGGDDPLALSRFDGDEIAAEPDRLADEANAVSMFGDRRAIRVSAGSRSLEAALKPLLSAPPSHCLVVIEAGDLSPKSPLRALIERADTAAALPCYADTERDLANLVDEAARQAGLTIDPAARRLLVTHLGEDRRLSRAEIDKLMLYAAGTGRIGVEDIEAIVADAAPLASETIVDAAFLGDRATLDSGLTRAFAEKTRPDEVLGQALRHALALWSARQMKDAGDGDDKVLKSQRIFFKRADAFKTQLSRWRLPALEAAIADLQEAVARSRRESELAPAICARTLIGLPRYTR
jgi:DNA polymerase-3 subunit delta